MLEAARNKIQPGQGEVDLVLPFGEGPRKSGMITGKSSALLWQVLTHASARLGFEAVGDEAFKQLVLALPGPAVQGGYVVNHARAPGYYRDAPRWGCRLRQEDLDLDNGPLAMDPDLVKAHDNLDRIVDRASVHPRKLTAERRRLVLLFTNYQALTFR